MFAQDSFIIVQNVFGDDKAGGPGQKIVAPKPPKEPGAVKTFDPKYMVKIL